MALATEGGSAHKSMNNKSTSSCAPQTPYVRPCIRHGPLCATSACGVTYLEHKVATYCE